MVIYIICSWQPQSIRYTIQYYENDAPGNHLCNVENAVEPQQTHTNAHTHKVNTNLAEFSGFYLFPCSLCLSVHCLEYLIAWWTVSSSFCDDLRSFDRPHFIVTTAHIIKCFEHFSNQSPVSVCGIISSWQFPFWRIWFHQIKGCRCRGEHGRGCHQLFVHYIQTHWDTQYGMCHFVRIAALKFIWKFMELLANESHFTLDLLTEHLRPNAYQVTMIRAKIQLHSIGIH